MEGVRFFTKGRYYQYTRQGNDGTYLGVVDDTGNLVSASSTLFNINSESPCDPTATKALQDKEDDIKWPTQDKSYQELSKHIHVGVRPESINDFYVKTTMQYPTTLGEVNMSNNTQRKVVEVQLFDDAKGLPVQDSLVAKFENVLTEDDNDTTIREVIMNNDIKKVLAAHNVKRSKVINQDILERTGNSVPLQPILLKDLRWKVIG
jgi:hypothetical protein